MKNITNITESITYISSVLGIAISVQDLESILSIIVLFVSITCSLITLVFRVVDKFKKANEDGKITKEELKVITDDITHTLDEVKEEVNGRDK